MQGSPSIKPFEERAKAWATKLVLIQDLIDIWLKVQGVWQYLEPIFGSDDIMRQSMHAARNSNYPRLARHLKPPRTSQPPFSC